MPLGAASREPEEIPGSRPGVWAGGRGRGAAMKQAPSCGEKQPVKPTHSPPRRHQSSRQHFLTGHHRPLITSCLELQEAVLVSNDPEPASRASQSGHTRQSPSSETMLGRNLKPQWPRPLGRINANTAQPGQGHRSSSGTERMRLYGKRGSRSLGPCRHVRADSARPVPTAEDFTIATSDSR